MSKWRQLFSSLQDRIRLLSFYFMNCTAQIATQTTCHILLILICYIFVSYKKLMSNIKITKSQSESDINLFIIVKINNYGKALLQNTFETGK